MNARDPQSRRPQPVDKVIPAEELLRGSREVIIALEGDHYRLRLTRNRKLILTK